MPILLTRGLRVLTAAPQSQCDVNTIDCNIQILTYKCSVVFIVYLQISQECLLVVFFINMTQLLDGYYRLETNRCACNKEVKNMLTLFNHLCTI